MEGKSGVVATLCHRSPRRDAVMSALFEYLSGVERFEIAAPETGALLCCASAFAMHDLILSRYCVAHEGLIA